MAQPDGFLVFNHMESIEIRDTRNGDWHWVYNALLFDPHLTIYEKIAYSSLAAFHGANGIYPSIVTIAQKCGVSERRTRMAIKNLIKTGYISKEERTGKSSLYLLLKKSKGCIQCTPARGAPPPLHATTQTPARGAPKQDIEQDYINKREKLELLKRKLISQKII